MDQFPAVAEEKGLAAMTEPPESRHDQSPRSQDVQSEKVIEEIRHSLQGLRFGSLLVIVQDGVVVQIDRTEKKRLSR